MSKATRRQQRLAKTSSGPAAGGSSAASGPAAGGSSATDRPNASAGTTRPTATPTRTSTSPSGTPRAGRRPVARTTYERPFLERYRMIILGAVAVAAVVLVGAFVFTSAAGAAYTCVNQFQPSPTPSPAAGATPQLGYQQEDQGRSHVAVGDPVTYIFCPPASGSHVNTSGFGPIAPRFYAVDDKTIPEGWVHNLEHGALVLLYRGDGPGGTADGQAALKSFFSAFPASPVCNIAPGTLQGPVITRFDDMPYPFAALVWGRVLPLQTLDTATILAFYQQWGEKTNPEPLCASPSPTTSGSPSASASASVSPS